MFVDALVLGILQHRVDLREPGCDTIDDGGGASAGAEAVIDVPGYEGPAVGVGGVVEAVVLAAEEAVAVPVADGTTYSQRHDEGVRVDDGFDVSFVLRVGRGGVEHFGEAEER